MNSNRSNSPPLSEKKFMETVFILKLFLHAAAAFLQQSRPARTREVQTCMLHVHDIAG